MLDKKNAPEWAQTQPRCRPRSLNAPQIWPDVKKKKRTWPFLCATQVFTTSKRFDWIIHSHVIAATKTEKDLNEELKIDTRDLFKPTR